MVRARGPAASERYASPPAAWQRSGRCLRHVVQRLPRYASLAVGGLLAATFTLPFPATAQDNARATAIQMQGQPTPEVLITAPSVLLGEPASETRFVIEVGPPEAVPRNSFLRIRGLPHMVALTEGYAVAPGAWAVPIVALPKLRLAIPVGLSGRSDIGIALVSMEGAIIAEAKTALVIAAARLIAPSETPPPVAEAPKAPVQTPQRAPEPAAKSAALPPAAAPVPSAPIAPARPALSPEARQRATQFMSRATSLLDQGNIAAARLFFERAAEEGSAEGALALGGTYDEAELANMKSLGLKPDPRLARRWYERARDLGSSAAEARLTRLGPAR